jgi:hypothetical protein
MVSGFLVSSTNKTNRHDISEILLTVVLNTINLNQTWIYMYLPIIFDTSLFDLLQSSFGFDNSFCVPKAAVGIPCTLSPFQSSELTTKSNKKLVHSSQVVF